MKSSIEHIIQALKLVWNASKKYTILLIITQFLKTILPLVLLYLIKLIVDAVTQSSETDLFDVVIRYLIGFGIVHLLRIIVDNVSTLISESQQRKVTDYMSALVIEKATEVDMAYYENDSYHDTFHIAQRQAAHRPIQVLNNLSDLIQSSMLLIGLGGLLFMMHWSVILILIVFSIPIALVKWYFSKRVHDWEVRKTAKEREAGYLNVILTTEPYAKEIRLFNLGRKLLEKFKSLRHQLFEEIFKINSARSKLGILAQSAEAIAMVLTFGLISWYTFKKMITIGDMVMYFTAFQQGQQAMQRVFNGLVGLYQNRLFLKHIFELLDYKPDVSNPENPVSLDESIDVVAFNKVNFSYPNTNKKVLDNINVEFKKSEINALVGVNGSGKTTLIKLLCRLYDAESGQIKFNEQDIKNLSLNNLRDKISVIFQDFSKYQFSAGDNIRIGRFEDTEDLEQLKKASITSGAYEFIQSFPKTFGQQLGRWFKSGEELSGGQWQKIALARAFYKSKDIIILDEPTGAIDPLAEYEIFKALKEMAKDKIIILITHRLYNLKEADKIIVMDAGKILEEGNHDSLMENESTYYKMFLNQQ